jgi:hypothetical protein
MRLASTAKLSPPSNPSAMQHWTTLSKRWRRMLLSRNRPWRLREKVE